MNAPGSENTTTVLPLKSSSVVTSFHCSFSRVLNVTFGNAFAFQVFGTRQHFESFCERLSQGGTLTERERYRRGADSAK